MKILIIEDEERASEHLKRIISRLGMDIEIIQVLDSVKSANDWFEKNEAPEGIISDIQLGDGRAFEIYSSMEALPPIIFTTAYDQYAINAFKANGIDYLLKPVDAEELKAALEKMRGLLGKETRLDLDALKQVFSQGNTERKSRFVIKARGKLKTVPIEEVCAFYSYSGDSYLHSKSKHSYAVDYTMDQLEGLLDEHRFFRINRAMIIAYDFIDTIHMWSGSRLKIELKDEIQSNEDDVVVSRERVKAFKAWLDR